MKIPLRVNRRGRRGCRRRSANAACRRNFLNGDRSWASYFPFGYPSRAFERVKEYVETRLYQHLRRRSQRPFRTPECVSAWEHLQRLGWRPLRRSPRGLPAKA